MPLVLSVYVGFLVWPSWYLSRSMIPLTSPIVMLDENSVWCTFVANCHFCKFTICDLLSVVWFAAKYIVWEF
jgi:hypothetical protein